MPKQLIARNTFKILSFTVFIILSSCGNQSEKTFLYEPTNPKRGDILTFKYFYSDKVNKNVEGAILIYTVSNGIINAEEYPMEIAGTGLECHYHISDSAQALGFKFIIKGSKISDQMKQKTYTVQLYSKDGSLLKGTRAASAFLMGHGLINNKEPDNTGAYKLYIDEFEKNPSEIKFYIRPFSYLIYNFEGRGDWNATKKIEDVLSSLETSDLNEKLMLDVLYVYKNYLKDNQKADHYSNVIRHKYPKGLLVENEEKNKICNSNIEQIHFLLKNFKENFSYSENIYLLDLCVLEKLCQQSKFNEAKLYLKNLDVTYDDRWANYCSAFAQYAEISLWKTDFAFTEMLIDISLNLARKLIVSPRPEPNWLSKNQYHEKMKEKAASSAFLTAIKIYEKNKKFEKALKIAEEGYKVWSSCRELNLSYAKLLTENNKSKEAFKLLGQMISNGETSSDILKMFRSIYLKEKGNYDGYENYLTLLKNKFLNQYLEEVMSSLIKKPAPQFTLKDIKGKTVSLSDFKGDIVVLDFWSTWCQHCKASFPLFKNVLSEYSRNSKVKFLFINTWENSKNRSDMVINYLKENDYHLDCLIDQDNKISLAYEVTGLPTKIFIDPKGYIRYKSIGFDDSKMLDEIRAVIKLIK